MKRIAAALILFGIAFGYVEASVVVYLRAFYDPLRAQCYPNTAPGELFPILRLEQLRAAGPQFERMLAVEVGREAATLLMLAGIGLTFARTAGQWLAGFVIAFGFWDLAFYAFLKLLIGWPSSPLTWDLLFLIPVPWAGPVLAPVLVSVTMIAAGFVFLARERSGRPVHARPGHWAGVMLGGVIVVIAFTLDSANLLAGGLPAPFPWWLFALGETVGVGAFAGALRS